MAQKKYDGHIAHQFKRVNLVIYRKHYANTIANNLIKLRALIQRYNFTDYQLKEKLIARELIGKVLQANGFFPIYSSKESISRYYQKKYLIDSGEGLFSSVQIRVSDHPDHTSRNHKGWRSRIGINFIHVDNTDDAIHLAVKRAIKYSMW